MTYKQSIPQMDREFFDRLCKHFAQNTLYLKHWLDIIYNMNSIKRLIISLLATVSLLNFGVVTAQQDELLPPEQAFALQAWIENNSLVAEFQIADGYYMYRERFDFQVESDNARFDTPIIPDGKIKNDEFFGEMEVYRNAVRIELPIIYQSTDTGFLRVKTTSQGCADIGVCYPPLQQSLDIDTSSTARVYPTAYEAPIASQPDDNVQILQALLGDRLPAANRQPRPTWISLRRIVVHYQSCNYWGSHQASPMKKRSRTPIQLSNYRQNSMPIM